jgi:predicted nucleic acid-binding protein
VIYADTSALAKLVVREAETGALRRWLSEQGDFLVTNQIGVVELQRLAARVGPDAACGAAQLLARIDQLALTATAVSRAAALPPPEMRALDALHVASAAELEELSVLLTYDQRLADAAARHGLCVASPR